MKRTWHKVFGRNIDEPNEKKLRAVLAQLEPELLAGTLQNKTPNYKAIGAEFAKRNTPEDPHDSAVLMRLLARAIDTGIKTDNWQIPLPQIDMPAPACGPRSTSESQTAEWVHDEIYFWICNDETLKASIRNMVLLALEYPWETIHNLSDGYKALLCDVRIIDGWPAIQLALRRRVGQVKKSVSTRHYLGPNLRVSLESAGHPSPRSAPRSPRLKEIRDAAPRHLKEYFRQWGTLLRVIRHALRQKMPPALVDGSYLDPFTVPSVTAPTSNRNDHETDMAEGAAELAQPDELTMRRIQQLCRVVSNATKRPDSLVPGLKQLRAELDSSAPMADQLCTHLLDYAQFRLIDQNPTVKPVTIETLLYRIGRPLATAFASTPNQNIAQQAVVERLIHSTLDSVPQSSQYHLSEHLKQFHTVMVKHFGWAKISWKALRNSRQLENHVRSKRYLLSANNVKLIVNEAIRIAKTEREKVLACTLICFSAGLRMGERGFRIRDLSSGLLQPQIWVRDSEHVDVKTNCSDRFIPLYRLVPEEWWKLLTKFRDQLFNDGRSVDSPVLSVGENGSVLSESYIRTRLAKIQISLFGQVLGTPHAFRHSLVSRLFLIDQIRDGCPMDGPGMNLIKGDWLRRDSLINRLGLPPVLSAVGMDCNAGYQPFVITYIGAIMGHASDKTTLASYTLNTPEVYLLWNRRLQPRLPAKAIQNWSGCGKSAAYDKRKYWLDYSPESVLGTPIAA